MGSIYARQNDTSVPCSNAAFSAFFSHAGVIRSLRSAKRSKARKGLKLGFSKPAFAVFEANKCVNLKATVGGSPSNRGSKTGCCRYSLGHGS